MTPKRKPARETWTGGALPDGLFTRDVTVYVTTWRALAAACIAFFEEEGWGTVGYEPGILFRHEDGRTVDMPTWLALRIQSGKVRAAELEAARAKFKTALDKINDIRNSIIGLAQIGWSEHIYPLVAALDEAGIKGMPYKEARSHFTGILDRAIKAEGRAAELEAALRALVEAVSRANEYPCLPCARRGHSHPEPVDAAPLRAALLLLAKGDAK